MTIVGHKTPSIYRRYNVTSDAAAKLNAASKVTKSVTIKTSEAS
jgi:hypothetical protein